MSNPTSPGQDPTQPHVTDIGYGSSSGPAATPQPPAQTPPPAPAPQQTPPATAPVSPPRPPHPGTVYGGGQQQYPGPSQYPAPPTNPTQPLPPTPPVSAPPAWQQPVSAAPASPAWPPVSAPAVSGHIVSATPAPAQETEKMKIGKLGAETLALILSGGAFLFACCCIPLSILMALGSQGICVWMWTKRGKMDTMTIIATVANVISVVLAIICFIWLWQSYATHQYGA